MIRKPVSFFLLLAAALLAAGCVKKVPPTESTSTVVIALDMVSIPAGAFTMGCQLSDPYPQAYAQPQRTVYLSAYQISRNEITNAEYKVFIDSGGYNSSDYWSAAGWSWRTANSPGQPVWWASGNYKCGPAFPTHPVVGITWYEADAFARWAGVRLPTEAEWERAARGTDGRYWPWGDSWDSTRCNSSQNAALDTFACSCPAGSFSTGASPCGALEMAGNAAEFTSDWYDSTYYSAARDTNPAGPASGTVRVIRGGGWRGSKAAFQCFWRDAIAPNVIGPDLGFRVAE